MYERKHKRKLNCTRSWGPFGPSGSGQKTRLTFTPVSVQEDISSVCFSIDVSWPWTSNLGFSLRIWATKVFTRGFHVLVRREFLRI